MQYMLMIFEDETRLADLSEAQRRQMLQECDEVAQSIVVSGHYRTSARLERSHTATTLRQHSGRLALTDGPFIESKEQVAGYYVVECKDLDEAIAIARRLPTLRRGGAVEVRPVNLS